MAKKKTEEKVSTVLVESVSKWDGHGAAVEKTKPEQAVYALELLAQGFTYPKVKELSGLGWDSVWRLKEDHKPALEARRAELAHRGFLRAQKTGAIYDMKLSQIADDPDEIKKLSLRDLAIAAGVWQDKGFDALGEGSRVTIEHKTAKVSLQDAVKAIEEARAALAQQAIDVTTKPVEDAK